MRGVKPMASVIGYRLIVISGQILTADSPSQQATARQVSRIKTDQELPLRDGTGLVEIGLNPV
jgi:hypothetical protein